MHARHIHTRIALIILALLLLIPFSQVDAAAEAAVPALTVAATADQAEIALGDQITYTIVVANVGQARAQNLALTVQLPSGLAFIAGSASVAGQVLPNLSQTPWALPPLEGGQMQLVTFRVQAQQARSRETYQMVASVSGQDSLGNPIPANQSGLVPADTDTDDRTVANVYGPLNWESERMLLGFEDLKKFAWTDWDYNDVVVRLTIRYGTLNGGALAVLEVQYNALARGAGFLNHALNHQFPISGGGWYALTVSDSTGKPVRQQQLGFSNANPDFPIFTRTRDALPQPSDAMEQTNTRPEQFQVVAGQRAMLTIALNSPTSNRVQHLPQSPWDPYLKVLESGQEVHLVQPGHLDNTQTVTGLNNTESPLLGYDLPLARVFPDGWIWPLEVTGIWRGYPEFARYIKTNGRSAKDWYLPKFMVRSWLWGQAIPTELPAAPATSTSIESRYFAAPLLADLQGDGQPEVIIGNLIANRLEVYDTSLRPLPGWPQPLGGGVRAAAAVANLDSDSALEILIGASDGKLYAWNADGTPLSGWPIRLGIEPDESYRILSTPAVADLNGDTSPEIVVALSDGRLYALDAAGQKLPGWPISLGEVKDSYGSQVINSSPRMADLDGDGALEIVVGSTDKHIYAVGADGRVRWRYATEDMILSTPAIADIDPLQPGLEVVIGSGDGSVSLLNSAGQLIWNRPTGWTVRSSPLLIDMDGDNAPEILIGSDDMKLWAWHADGSLVDGWPQATGTELFSTPTFGDIDGDGQPEIVIGGEDAQIYAWETSGTPVSGWPKTAREAIKGMPTMINLDDDPEMELIAGDMSGSLFIIGKVYPAFLPVITRP